MELLNQAGVPHKLFDELSRLIERFSQVDRGGIILDLTTNLSLTFICWGTAAVVHSQNLQGKFSLGKSNPKGFFFILKNVFIYFFWKRT